MIVKNYEIRKLNINKFKLFLFYGKNDGLQNEILDDFFLKNFDGQVNKYDENEFILNNEIIISELLNKSLFDNQKILIISRGTDKILRLVKSILEKELIDIKIIIKCGILEKKSKIRQFFEKEKNLVIVPFYEDDSKSLSIIISEFLNKEKISISRESINLLIARASGDRNNLKTELDKILNYSISNKKIYYESIKKLTNLSENYSVLEIVESFLNKDKKKISKILNENNYSNDDCILILRTILGKSKRLMDIITRYNDTRNIDLVMNSMKPPIFWKEKESIKKQVNLWDLNDLKNQIYKVNDLELYIKSNSSNSLKIISDFIINH